MKIILVTRDRPELTKQTIETMKANAADWSKHQLITVFDGSEKEARAFHPDFNTQKQGLLGLAVWVHQQLGVGGAKNYGVSVAEQDYRLQDDDILMFSDNDMHYLPNWDLRLLDAMTAWDGPFGPYITQLGGWRHPFHKGKVLRMFGPESLAEVDAVTGNCFIIRYSDWKKYGPFDANALGPGQSEDYALSQKIKTGGGLVATLDPPVAIHCGLANCLGNSAVGYEQMTTMAEQQITENNIDKIWLATPDEGTILLERNTGNSLGNFKGLNVGSGQRRFDKSIGWCNIDHCSRPPDQVPDMVCDATLLDTKFAENSQDMVVLHHVLEHFGCGEADEVLRQCYKVLKPSGSLLIFVPDLRKLAGRWLSGELEDFLFLVNVYGAYQGEEGDRHRWGFSKESLMQYLGKTLDSLAKFNLANIAEFDWREIPGADIARDWWVLAMEVIK